MRLDLGDGSRNRSSMVMSLIATPTLADMEGKTQVGLPHFRN